METLALHCPVKSIQRRAGKCAPAAAAYAAGIRIIDERLGVTHNYTRRRGVIAVGLVGWHRSIADLWNAAERAEKHPRGITGRTCVLGLPHQLDAGAHRAIVEQLSAAVRERWGVAVTWAVHAPDRHGDQRNHHAHLVWTSRAVTDDGVFGSKTRNLDVSSASREEIKWLRKTAAQLSNDQLERAGLSVRVDPRSLAERAEAGELTAAEAIPQIHLGPAASAMERKGIPTRAGDRNRAVRDLRALSASIAADEVALAALTAERKRITAELSRSTETDDVRKQETRLNRGSAEAIASSSHKQQQLGIRKPALGATGNSDGSSLQKPTEIHRDDARRSESSPRATVGAGGSEGAFERLAAALRHSDRRVAETLKAGAVAGRLSATPPIPGWSALAEADTVPPPPTNLRPIRRAIQRFKQTRAALLIEQVSSAVRGFLQRREEYRARQVLQHIRVAPPIPPFSASPRNLDRPAPINDASIRAAIGARMHPRRAVRAFAEIVLAADRLPTPERTATMQKSLSVAAALWTDPTTRIELEKPHNARLKTLAQRAATITSTASARQSPQTSHLGKEEASPARHPPKTLFSGEPKR